MTRWMTLGLLGGLLGGLGASLGGCSSIDKMLGSSQTPDYDTGQPVQQGHWETRNGQQVWIPNADQQQLPQPSGTPYTYAPQTPQGTGLGRYETVRYPDGRIERVWNPNAAATPAQGYWDVVTDPYGNQQRVWHPNALSNEK